MAESTQAPARDPSFSRFLSPVTLQVGTELLPNQCRRYPVRRRRFRRPPPLRYRRFPPFLRQTVSLGSADPFSTGGSSNEAPAMVSLPVGSNSKWKTKCTAEGMHLRIDMPGLGKEDVKVSVEQNNTLMVVAKGQKEFDDDDVVGPGYTNKIGLSEKLFEIKEMKAEMKNGVLKVFVPKIKKQERTDVFVVSVK